MRFPGPASLSELPPREELPFAERFLTVQKQQALLREEDPSAWAASPGGGLSPGSGPPVKAVVFL